MRVDAGKQKRDQANRQQQGDNERGSPEPPFAPFDPSKIRAKSLSALYPELPVMTYSMPSQEPPILRRLVQGPSWVANPSFAFLSKVFAGELARA